MGASTSKDGSTTFSITAPAQMFQAPPPVPAVVEAPPPPQAVAVVEAPAPPPPQVLQSPPQVLQARPPPASVALPAAIIPPVASERTFNTWARYITNAPVEDEADVEAVPVRDDDDSKRHSLSRDPNDEVES